jgi:methionyl-tRNA synthetase
MNSKEFSRYTVTTALPYVNGPLHIGHLAGVYVPADIYVRWLRLRGEDVLFIGGSDEHGVPITIRAEKEGVTPREIVDRYHTLIKDSFQKFGISFDIYSRTTMEIHHQTASDFFKTLLEKNELIVQEVEQLYDAEAKQFLADRYITGTCPHCSFERAYGDQCEQCGTSLSPTDLIQPRSVLTGNVPVLKKTRHWYLPLDKYSNWLEKWILEENKDWKSNVLGQCKSWINQGLQPRAVTRDLSWGVKVPLPEAAGKVLYVWFDAPIGYISAARDWSMQTGKDWKPYWQDKSSRLIHFIGKDNIVFHCIIFPSMLKAEGSFILPDNVPANEFLNLEGQKISTSRNWAVWLHEYLEEFPGMQDVLRFTLCSITPETKDSDFTWKDFQAKNNNELLAIFGNFVNRTMVLIHKFYNGEVPEITSLRNDSKLIYEQVNKLIGGIDDSLGHFKFREAQNLFMDIARAGNKYLTDNEPWKKHKTDAEHAAETLAVSAQIMAKLAVVCEPFLPFSSEKLYQMIQLERKCWENATENNFLAGGHQLGNPEFLFTKIEDEAIANQVKKLQETAENNKTEQMFSAETAKDEIVYEDFLTMDIRTATILEAEKVPKTKKLLKLTVDTGLDQRVIVSGIAEQYEPESLIGKKVIVLVNLAPRDLKGISSQGMILLAEDNNGKLTFVVPEKDTPDGSSVR